MLIRNLEAIDGTLILQYKPVDGSWTDVPTVKGVDIAQIEADERLAIAMATRTGTTPAKALEIIQAARASTKA